MKFPSVMTIASHRRARPLHKRAGSAARQVGVQLSMQPPLLHSSALRLRPSV